MKLNLITTLLCASFCNQLFAYPIDTQVSRAKSKTALSGMSVFLYLPLSNNADSSSIMAQNQLTITPSSSFTGESAVLYIQASVFDTTDGSCHTGIETVNIGSGEPPAVDLILNTPYSTTNASNYALKQLFLEENSHPFVNDMIYYFLNSDGTRYTANSQCIPGGGECTSSTNCGWTSTQTWAPAPEPIPPE